MCRFAIASNASFSWRLVASIAATMLGSACAAPPLSSNASPAPPPPNFVVILADDVGITDVGTFARRFTGVQPDGTFFETPNLDRLARRGVAFSQAYAAPLCSPTRASLLTGRTSARLGFTTATPPTRTFFSAGLAPPAGHHPLDALDHRDAIAIEHPLENGATMTALPAGTPLDGGRDAVTIAEALPRYRSVFVGKWHLGGHGAPGHAPADQGFEPLAWYDAGGSAYFGWRNAWNRTKPFFPTTPQQGFDVGDAGPPTGRAYLTDDLTQRAVAFVEEQTQAGPPFLLYLAHFAAHAPMEAKPDDIAAFAGKPQRGWKGQRNPTYAAMMRSLDQSVGAIVAALERMGLDRNTYIVFMSDNGGVDWQIGRNVAPVRVAPDTPYLGEAPPTSNVPFRGGKATLFEGGVRVPLIIAGPGVANAGRWIDRMVDVTDLFPTLYELAGHDPTQLYSDRSFDGRSLVSLLEGRERGYSRSTIYWHYPYNVIVPNPEDGLPSGPASAVRQGDYKLILDWHGKCVLYNIASDPFEARNLAREQPALANALLGQLVGWLTEATERHYLPALRDAYQPARDPRGPFRDVTGLLTTAARTPDCGLGYKKD